MREQKSTSQSVEGVGEPVVVCGKVVPCCRKRLRTQCKQSLSAVYKDAAAVLFSTDAPLAHGAFDSPVATGTSPPQEAL